MRVAGRSFVPLLVLFLLVSGSLFVAAQPVQAAGGDIRVIETHQQTNFPSGVQVSIAVVATAEIAEVRVYYRPVGSNKWGYAYADFEPGTRVVATRSIPVREATYIAPGADIEYYFEIRDVQGNSHKTDRAQVEYLDQRFKWERVFIGPLELLYHDIRDSKIEDASLLISEDLERVQELLALKHVDRIKGVIYNSYSDANGVFPVQSQTTTDRGTFAGYAFPEQRVFIGNGLDRRIVVHESAHLMLRQALGYRSVEVPAWLNEGFATYMEPRVKVRDSSDLYARTPNLTAMKNLSGTPETIPLFYQKSVSVVAHLIEEYGEDKFRLLLKEIARRRPIDVALVNVYGFDDHGLDSSWAGLPIPEPVAATPESISRVEPAASTAVPETRREFVAETTTDQEETVAKVEPSSATAIPQTSQRDDPPAESPTASPRPAMPQQREGPSPFVFFDIWILAGVALLAVVVLSARFIYNRLRRRNELSEEPWDDWRAQDSDYD